MLKKLKIKKGAKVMISAIVLVSVIGFTETRQSGEICKEVIIKISNQYDNYYIDDEDVFSLMTEHGVHLIKGQSFKDLNLKEIEQRVKGDQFIRAAEIYKDLKGNLIVHVDLRRPIARVIQKAGPHAYIAKDGTILSVSDKFSSRVTLISGDYARALVKENLTTTEEGRKIFSLINYINNDKFWKAQIAQIDIDKNLDIVLYPQVTKQYVEFGQPENLKAKFQKLKIFYEQILPRKGWNGYQRVNLKYEGQIIAE